MPISQQVDAARQLMQLKQGIYATLNTQYSQTIRREIQANMMTVVETAIVPEEYSQPRVMLNYFLGLTIGLIGGLGLAFIFEDLDTK
jgi:uncharacterized protein involved in exopolysaccharide biosynthesis